MYPNFCTCFFFSQLSISYAIFSILYNLFIMSFGSKCIYVFIV